MKNILLVGLLTFGFSNSYAQCFDIEADFTDSVSGNTVYFTDLTTTTNGWSVEKRYWLYGDSIMDSVILNPVHVYAQPGVYQVCLTLNGKLAGDSATALYCTETVCHTVRVINTGISETSSHEGLVYPNPSAGFIRIKKDRAAVKSVSVYNTKGQLLLKTFETDGFIELPINATNDLYFVWVETEHGNIVQQITILR